MKPSPIHVLSTVLMILLLSIFTFGQVTNTGSIAGTVTDAHGEVIPNASITVKNNASGLAWPANKVLELNYQLSTFTRSGHTATFIPYKKS